MATDRHPNRGRPKKLTGASTYLGIRLEQDLKDKLFIESQKGGITYSEIIRKALKLYLK